MPRTHEDTAEPYELMSVLIEADDGTSISVFYPSDATDEELETMWIRSEETDLTPVTDYER